MGKHRAHSKPKIVTGKRPLQKRKEREEMENEQDELQANEIRVIVKHKRYNSMEDLKPDLPLDPIKSSHSDVPEAVQDESTKDINVER